MERNGKIAGLALTLGLASGLASGCSQEFFDNYYATREGTTVTQPAEPDYGWNKLAKAIESRKGRVEWGEVSKRVDQNTINYWNSVKDIDERALLIQCYANTERFLKSMHSIDKEDFGRFDPKNGFDKVETPIINELLRNCPWLDLNNLSFSDRLFIYQDLSTQVHNMAR